MMKDVPPHQLAYEDLRLDRVGDMSAWVEAPFHGTKQSAGLDTDWTF